MYRIFVLMASLLGSLLIAAPGADARRDVTLAPPVSVSSDAVRLTGHVPESHRVVRLQRQVGGQWVDVRRLPVRGGRFEAQVKLASAPERYRAVVGRLSSPVRTVPGRPRVDPPPVDPPVEPPVEPPVDPPVAPPPPASDACGTAVFRADGTRRTCTFADDFGGTQLDRTKWLPQTNFTSGDLAGAYACYHDDPDNVSVADGALRLTLRKEAEPVPCGHRTTAPSRFTAGGVSTYHLFSQRYGRFEARVKSAASLVPGLQEAFWLWPDDRQQIPVLWPAAGEIDIAETYSEHPTLAIPFLHYTWNDNRGPVPGLNTAWNCAATRGAWNTYALEWTAQRLTIYVNGRVCLTNTSGDQAFQRSYIIALTQLLGAATNAPLATTPLPATMSVDYVRVWE